MIGSVLVLGAGIAGMRAAAELVQQGFKVYLLEQNPQVGGKMATIDRVFPTMEHTACALQPLMLVVVNNPNIAILTSTELESLEGVPGDFKVKARCRDERGAISDRRELEFGVGAVIVATGLEEEKGEPLSRLGYGRLDNVLTGLEFERQLSELGPTGGRPTLASGKLARRVTWIVRGEESAVTLMSASAQALSVLGKDNTAQVSILYAEAGAEYSRHAEFCLKVEERGASYVQASAPEVHSAQTGDLIVAYLSADGQREQLETELLVISAPLAPSTGNRIPADRLGLKLDERGFFRCAPGSNHPILTSREGVFVCGAAEGPKGIGASVIQACAAAAQAAALLAPARGSELMQRTKNLRPINVIDEPKIAVVIEEGGADTEGLLDLSEIAEYTRTLPGVGVVVATPCASDDGEISELISTGDFNRLIVVGPSPITHETLFQRQAEAAGLNRYLLEMVNLHNHCARVHAQDKSAATQKAKIVMKMGVVRARQLEPLQDVEVNVTRSCLVIGGCPSGVACASMLAAMGVRVHLVEKEAELEGVHGNDDPLVRPLVAGLATNGNVAVHTAATVRTVDGSLGHFDVELIRQGKEERVTVGAIVLASATGIEEARNGLDLATCVALEKDEDGLYLSTQGILNPLDFVTEGMFNCGPARAVLGTEDAIVDGEAAASRAACILSSSVLLRPPVVSVVVHENCDGCAYCVDPCPTGSITLLEFMEAGAIKKVVDVNETTCIGCGICMATCPKKGIFVRHFKPEYAADMVEAALQGAGSSGDEPQPLIVCFCCNRCAYPGTDAAALVGAQYPTSVRIIRTVCSGTIHPNIITDALTQGADGVLLCGCHPGECRSREGIRRAQDRAEAISLLLEDFGLEQERFRLEFIAASEGRKFARIVQEMTDELAALGPSPYKQ